MSNNIIKSRLDQIIGSEDEESKFRILDAKALPKAKELQGFN